jgi:anti-sigma factor RsiW
MRLRIRILRRSLVCRQAVELVTDYLEGRLSRSDHRRFETHLASCPHCTEYLAQLRATVELTGRIGSEDLTAPMRDDFITLFRAWQADRNEA